MLWIALVCVLMLVGCAAPTPARFANWEPVRDDIPRTASRAEAAARLAASFELWRKWRAAEPPEVRKTGRAPLIGEDGYTYVRSRQASASEVSFTVLAVRGERVVLRALLSADPRQLSSIPRRAGQRRPIVAQWVERGAAIGTHSDAAPAKTIDQLYAQCGQLIAQAETTPPRLYFHPNGLLMQCGYPPAECRHCPSLSVSAVSRFLVDQEPARESEARASSNAFTGPISSLGAAAWLCETETGPVPPGSELPFFPTEWACFAPEYPVSLQLESQLAQSQLAQEATADNPGTPALDPCSVDPAACAPPYAGYGVAHLLLVFPQICPTGVERAPSALEVGKSDPLRVWTFPFNEGGSAECDGRTFLRAIWPQP
jgi:hypothetical protein